MFPNANQIAWAIVEACRATGESPISVAEHRVTKSRARQYAFQSLVAVFPDANKKDLAYRCGCSGNPVYYANNSCEYMKRFLGGRLEGKRKHLFWDEAIFARVIQAVRMAEVGSRAVAAESPAEDVDAEPSPRTLIKLSAAYGGGIVEPTRPSATPGKNKLRDMLAEAVQNTARLPIPTK